MKLLKHTYSQYICIAIVCMTGFAAAIWAISPYAFCYAEGSHTFYYYMPYIADQIHGGHLWALAQSFVLQFCVTPMQSIIVISLLLTLITLLLMWVARKLIHSRVIVLCVTMASAVLMFAGVWRTFSVNRNSARFQQLSYMSRYGQWDAILASFDKKNPVSNLLYQNFLNLALAEKHLLGERLLDQPCQDIRSIYVDAVQNEEVAVLLSDIYWSMGHIALSQRYAFESNEKMGNLSARMLQRLVKTNILYGQYEVAEKYLKWLDKTLYYRTWCRHYRTFLWNDHAVETDAELGMKRKCLLSDNRLSGLRGLDDDLLNIARSTRGTSQSRTTLNYLGSLYILAGYTSQFTDMMKEFSRSADMPDQPKYFRQYSRHLAERAQITKQDTIQP